MSSSTSGERKPNRLVNESSPYLKQHAYNPVDWYPWGEEAFETARSQNKPIFLSIGYSTCHWCHVMERESFENETIAQLMNERFVCIKVDREERPDLDEVYMQSAQLLTGQGGWPLSVFLVPDLRPFYAGTYFPPTDAFGRPGFPRVLASLSEAYKNRGDEVVDQARQIAEAIVQNMKGLEREGRLSIEAVNSCVSEILADFDDVHGGFGQAPKFPPAFALMLLLRQFSLTRDNRYLNPAIFTLDAMARGGIFDQIGGGFHRYSTDSMWLVPHFEKMLYDNALLSQVLLEAYQVTGRPDFAEIASRTLDFVLREMTHPGGGFQSALDADSEGEEGKYYVWTPGQVKEILVEREAELFCNVYGITETGNFEDQTSIPYLSARMEDKAKLNDMPLAEFQAMLAAGRDKLLHAREKRIRPGLDEKVIVSWNGLMIQSMAFAGRVLGQSLYTNAAVKAAEFILENVQRDGNLAHSWGSAGAVGVAFQDDYATFAASLLELYAATGDERWVIEADELAAEMISRFWDSESGGFFLTHDGHDTPLARSKSPVDGVTPSGNSVAVALLFRLGRLLGKNEYLRIAGDTLDRFGGIASRAPRAFENLLVSYLLVSQPPSEVVLAGDAPDSPDLLDLLGAFSQQFQPFTVLAWNLPESRSLFVSKGRDSVSARAFVCKDYACQQPVSTPQELLELI